MINYKFKLQIVFVLLFSYLSSLQAAEITMSYRNSDKDASQIIHLTGTIYKEDVIRFTKVLQQRGNRNVYIVLKLKGGDFFAALEMANQINKINKNGGNIETSAICCHSACFFIAAAGKKKWVLYSKNVFGVHYPYHKNRTFINKKKHRKLYDKQVSSLMKSGFSKDQALNLVNKSLTGSPDRTIKFSRKELIKLGFILL